MAFTRDINSEPIKYADKHFPKCPFCQTNVPDWSVDIIEETSRTKRYIYRCYKCEGIFELKSTSSKDFKENTFSEVIMGNIGRGQYNYNMRGKETDIAALCDMCGYDINQDYEEVVETPRELAGRSDFALGGYVREDVTARGRTTTTSSGSSTTRGRTTTTSSGSSSTTRTTTSSGSSTVRTTTSSGSSTTRRSSTSSYGGYSSSSYKPKQRSIGITGLVFGIIAFIFQFIGFILSTSGDSASGKSFLLIAVVLSVPGLICSIMGQKTSSHMLASIFGIILSGLAMMLGLVLFICYL